MTKIKKSIKYGKVELAPDEFDPKYAKFRMTMWINQELLNKLKAEAEGEGLPYQTWIQQILKKHVEGSAAIEDRLARVERVLKIK